MLVTKRTIFPHVISVRALTATLVTHEGIVKRTSKAKADPDSELRRLFAELSCGHIEAMEGVWEVLATDLYGLALWRTGNSSDAEDVVQEVFDLDVRKPLGNEADYSEIWLRGFRNTVARVQLTAAQRQLVQAAIVLRSTGHEHGSYPAALPAEKIFQTPDPFTGRRLVYDLNDDGSATIALDGVERLMEKVVIKRSAKTLPITLPPRP